MTTDVRTNIATFDAGDLENHLGELGELLRACVLDGASIGFVLPFPQEEAEQFWTTKVLPGVRAGTRVLLAAWIGERIAGSVQLDHGTMPNQPHRAEVAKLLVHPDFRRMGLAKALMAELELHAGRLRRSLLTLDTRTGDKAEPLYTSLGYRTVGIIPGYCVDALDRTRLDSTTIMYKTL
jgi:ribosomal protein S18 acetylase RimI-like enzyme